MFDGFAHVWTPVALARQLRHRPMGLTIAGERVVLFRGKGGAPAALLDRCPHRGVKLSLGRVLPEGTLECPFHGWRFDRAGACVEAPLNPRARCELLSATVLPVREVGGLLWLYTAPGATAPTEPVLPEPLADPAFNTFWLVVHWKAHWTRAMENMLDTPHVPFVHKRTIGFATRRKLRPGSELVMDWQPTEHGARIVATLDGVTNASPLEFIRPNHMMLRLPVPGKRMCVMVYCVPVGPKEVRMMLATSRDFGRYNPLARVFDQVNRLIALEDQKIVESSDPVEIPPAGQERSVASDRPTLQFRRYYHEVLRPSTAQPLVKLQSIGLGQA